MSPAMQKLVRSAAWVLIPCLGAVWAVVGLRHTWFFYDEWSMIHRVTHLSAADGAFASFNGHLWVLQYFIYWSQVSWFGVDSHQFVAMSFVASLVLMHLAIAAVLRAAEVPLSVSLLGAGLVTYLGVASQNTLFAVQLSPTLTTALCFGSAAVALARPPTPWSMTTIGAWLLMAVGVDSGMALPGIVFATIVIAGVWRSRHVLVIVPALLALGAWFVAGDLGPSFPSSISTRLSFLMHLLLRSLGGVIGGTESSGTMLAVAAVVIVGIGWRRGVLAGTERTLLLAGTSTAFLTAVAIAQARAGVVGDNFTDFNRYLQNVAVPLFVGLVPAVAVTLRSVSGRRAFLSWVPSALIVAAFVAGLGPRRTYASTFVGWNVAVRQSALSATTIIRDGCPPGLRLDPASAPAGDLSPQMTTRLLVELMNRGAMTAPAAWDVDPEVLGRMCPKAQVASQ